MGSVAEYEMRSDRGQERVRQKDDRSGKAGWLDGEKFAKVCKYHRRFAKRSKSFVKFRRCNQNSLV